MISKITTTNGSTVSERHFLWCGDELCQSRNASDTIQEHFYQEGIHTLIPNHESTYAIKDHLGSVHKNIGINSQFVYASFYYNPYGWFYRSSQTGTNLDEFRYAGMFYLPEAELYFTRYRAYDPSTGRWLSRDPIAEQGGINLYGYVGGNPVNYTDRSGLFLDEAAYQSAVTATAKVATSTASAALAGVAGVLYSPSVGEGSDIVPNCPPDDCNEIIAQIQERLKELTGRYMDQCRDKKNQWASHAIEFNNKKSNLAKLVAQAEAKGCPVPPKAYEWLSTECPMPGTDRNTSPGY